MLTFGSFVPETRNRTLEELDRMFGSSAWDLIKFGVKQIGYFVEHKILRRDVGGPPVLPCDVARRKQHEIENEPDEEPFERARYNTEQDDIPDP
jgi:hypothetical protein